MERRDFIKSAVASAVTAGATLSDSGRRKARPAAATPPRPMSPDMQYRDLGRTGEKVSVIGLGGYHLGRQADPEESVRLVRTAIDRGIAFTAVKTFQPMTQQQIASLLDRTRDAVADGRYELFKTTAHFDGTAANPKWLG